MFKLLFNFSMIIFNGAKNKATNDQYKSQPAKIPIRFTDQYSEPKPLAPFRLLSSSRYF